jgi:hypothetical protein
VHSEDEEEEEEEEEEEQLEKPAPPRKASKPVSVSTLITLPFPVIRHFGGAALTPCPADQIVNLKTLRHTYRRRGSSSYGSHVRNE